MDNLNQYATVGSLLNNIVGQDIASAATLAVAPTSLIHRITGTTATATIPVPTNVTGFAGLVIFITNGVWTWTAAGNIAAAGTVTTAGSAAAFVWNPVTAKWHPLRVA